MRSVMSVRLFTLFIFRTKARSVAESNARERGNAVDLTSILDRRQFFSST